MVLIALCGGIVPYLLLALLAVVCSLAVARLFWALVEVPSRALGKALDRRYLASVTPVNAPVARGGIN
jgi:peptidoglycan/LPS O-acetylase OafA/YrhL